MQSHRHHQAPHDAITAPAATQVDTRRRRALAAIAGLASFAALPSARAAAALAARQAFWPSQPIRLVVGSPVGTAYDVSARAIAPGLQAALGVAVEIRNVAGLSAAAEEVVRSQDGHTFGVLNNAQLSIAQLLNPKAGYEPLADLTPVAVLGSAPMVMVATNGLPGHTPADLLEQLRERAESARYACAGLGTPSHLGMELVIVRAKLLMHQQLFAGTAQALAAVQDGRAEAALLPLDLVREPLRQGKVKLVGLAQLARSSLATQMPTLEEAGLFRVDVVEVAGLVAPRSAPAAVVQHLSQAVLQAAHQAPVQAQLVAAGWVGTASGGEELRARMRDDQRALGGVILMRGIRLDA